MATDQSGRPITKVYVDSEYRLSPNTTGAGNFRYEIPGGGVVCGDPCFCAVADCQVPHSFYNVSSHARFIYLLQRGK